MIFFKEFLKNRKQIGSIIPSSFKLAKAMVEQIDYTKAKVIVELGAGLGTFTDLIAKKIDKNTKLIVIEINDKFYDILKERFKDNDNIILIKEDARKLKEILKECDCEIADYVISGLPFLNFPKEMRDEIFKVVSTSIKYSFIMFQYTKLLEKEILEYYKILNKKKILLNIPPANIYILTTKDNIEKNN